MHDTYQKKNKIIMSQYWYGTVTTWKNHKATIPSTDCDRSKTTGGCVTFQMLGLHDM